MSKTPRLSPNVSLVLKMTFVIKSRCVLMYTVDNVTAIQKYILRSRTLKICIMQAADTLCGTAKAGSNPRGPVTPQY